MGPVNTLDLDCKTVRIFAYSSTREQSNKRSGTRLKTESETGERRFFFSRLTSPKGCVWLARFERVRLLRHAFPISLLILRKKPGCSAVYIGLVFDVIVGFPYKPSLNSFFVYDFVLAIDCNQLLLIERFSYDLETKTREQNRNNKRTEIERFVWFIERMQTRVAFVLVKRTLGWKNFTPENFLEINQYFGLTSYFNTIG